jgi:fengycin family lipopeptide synthetase D
MPISVQSSLDRKALDANRAIAARNYWKQRMQGFSPAVYLDMHPPESVAGGKKYEYAGYNLEIPQHTAETLNNMASSPRSLQVLMLSALGIFLQKLSEEPDILLVTDWHSENGMQQLIPVRLAIDPAQNFRQLITLVKENIITDFSYGNFPAEKIWEMVAESEPVIQKLCFTMQGTQYSEEDILFTCNNTNGSLYLNIQYRSGRFEPGYISSVGRMFVRFLGKLVCNTGIPLATIKLVEENEIQLMLEELPAAERKSVLHGFSDTAAPYPSNGNIISLFEQQAAKTPQQKAFQFGGFSMTYNELDTASGQFAAYLKEVKQVKKGDLIGVLLEREEYLIPAIYGILKAGCAYIPMDPHYPSARIQDILDDSGMQHVITRRKHLPQDVLFDGWTDLDASLEEILSQQKGREEIRGNDLAYIIYTSGSTGKPKGVMIEHHSVVNRLLWMQKMYPLGTADVIMQKTPVVFDVSVWELFWWSFTGSSLYLLPPGGEKDTGLMLEIIEREQITTMHFVPSMLGIFLGEVESKFNLTKYDSLRYVFASGEALQPVHVQLFEKTLWRWNRTALINLYGPTEATVDVSYYACNFNEPVPAIIPIGRPIDNVRLYIVDRWGCPVGIGVAGELCIAGVGLARGYLNNKELTDTKFIKSVLLGERVYRTGDLARWAPDGNIIFLGRIDNQVKLRGLRIELGEIEYRLSGYEGIRDCAVLLKEKNGEPYLVGYYVSASALNTEALSGYLTSKLPAYMVPSFFVHLDKLPLTVNGKLDRKALPLPEVEAGEAYEGPATETEQQLVEIWSEVLKLEAARISVNRSFFELGGHSLKAVSLVNRIRKELGAEIRVKDIFLSNTIRELAVLTGLRKTDMEQHIVKAAQKDWYVLSAAQKRMYFINQFDPESLAYNMPNAVRLRGVIHMQKAEDTMNRLVSRHEVLRTVFKMENDLPVQVIKDQVPVKLEVYNAAEEEVPALMKSFIRPFNLATGPLIRMMLICLGGQEYVFAVDVHHITADGVSLEMIMNDFVGLYRDREMPLPELQYKDYAEWQQSSLQQLQLKEHKEYWLQKFSGEIPLLTLPADFDRPAMKNNAGNAVTFQLTREETDAVKQKAAAEGTSQFMLLLGVWHVLLSRLSGQEDIITGTPFTGRQHTEFEKVAGMFINTLALRTQPESGLRFTDYIKNLTAAVLESFEHHSYQYEELVTDLKVERNPARNPLFDAMFNLQNFEKEEIGVPGLTYKPYRNAHANAKFDLLLMALENDGMLTFELEYATSLFTAATIHRFVQYFKNILTAVTKDTAVKIGAINVLPAEETKRLLETYNDTTAPCPAVADIITLFEMQAAKTPGKMALQFADFTLTYKELDGLSGQFAAYLKNHINVKRGSFIGIMMEREEYLVPAIYGILKAGCAYIPVDPDYPAARIQNIIDDSGMAAIITRKKYLPDDVTFNNWIDLDTALHTIGQQRPSREPILPGDLAYIIYTSGSTGMPKGVMIEHQSLVCRMAWIQRDYPVSESDVFMLKTPVIFDVSLWELFWWSFTGASLYILPPGGEKEPLLMLDVIEKHKVSVMQFVPSMLKQFLATVHEGFHLQMLNSLRLVMACGEVLQPQQAEIFDKTLWAWNRTRLVNTYGPTEATIVVSHCECDMRKPVPNPIPIGRPSENVHLYILDKAGYPVPEGVAGELCIGGAGLARGYLNNEKLTAEKFINGTAAIPERIYKTGDLAKWLPGGIISFLGRMDNQVKLRGQRIEPGEIEFQLLSFPGIAEAAVLMKILRDEQHLVAYYTTSGAVNTENIRSYLQQRLPAYMVPACFMQLGKMPLSVNGKLDKKMLPDPEAAVVTGYEPPETETEKTLVQIWAEVLRIPASAVSVDRSFFDSGGHSLLAMTVVNKILQLNKVTVPLKIFFVNSSVRLLAEYVDMQLWLLGNNETTVHENKIVI